MQSFRITTLKHKQDRQIMDCKREAWVHIYCPTIAFLSLVWTPEIAQSNRLVVVRPNIPGVQSNCSTVVLNCDL